MNMRDVAARVGVSSATVSRVINGSPLVKPETAQRVQEVLDQINFIPNPMATTLKYGRSKTFGLIIPDICNPFYAEFLGKFEDLLIEMDHEVLVTSVQTEEKLLKSIRRMLMRQVDGVVLMASEFDTKAIEPLLRNRIPIATVDRRHVEVGMSDVAVDFEQGFAAAVQHLLELGHTEIGYIGGNAQRETTRVRARAFEMALKTAGLKYHKEWSIPGDYRLSGGEAAVPTLMKLQGRPTALITANDLTAFGVLRGLHAVGLSVPRDISLVGVDDVLLDQVLHPPLTTIRIPRQRLAKLCIEALDFSKKHDSEPGYLFSVATELIVRESTAAPARKQRSRGGRG